ncbi:MAG TPA: hypothetical protein DIW51_00635 [Rhodospirillaceae bacterium]|nr:hypothetical protein [Rhodospirillaceae bacterium]HCS68455.1 hypothetical protein [Rhodospirillaceae bacterium]|tara:strand:+ start:392 stop:1003 length:612 start_codon:yes stop_codon:yes gene_type:complete
MVERNLRTLIRDLIRPLGQALRRIAGRSKVLRITAAAANAIQRVQVVGLGGNPREAVEHAEPYGLAAYPMPGAEAWVVANAGDQAQLIAFVIGDPRHHPLTLQPGEVCLYSKHGQRVHLKAGGDMDIYAPGDVHVEAANVTVDATGDITVNAAGKAVVNCEDLHLGTEDGPPVARVGDLVNVGSGSSAGTWPIVSGSDKVRAG